MSKAPTEGEFIRFEKANSRHPQQFAYIQLFFVDGSRRAMQDELLFRTNDEYIAEIVSLSPPGKLLRWQTKVLEQLPQPSDKCRG